MNSRTIKCFFFKLPWRGEEKWQPGLELPPGPERSVGFRSDIYMGQHPMTVKSPYPCHNFSNFWDLLLENGLWKKFFFAFMLVRKRRLRSISTLSKFKQMILVQNRVCIHILLFGMSLYSQSGIHWQGFCPEVPSALAVLPESDVLR